MRERRKKLKNKFLRAIIRGYEEVKSWKLALFYVVFFMAIIVLAILSIIYETAIWGIVAVCLLQMLDIFEKVLKDAIKIFDKNQIQLEDISIYKIILGNEVCVYKIEMICLCILVGLKVVYDVDNMFQIKETSNNGINIIITIVIIVVIIILAKVFDIISKKVSKCFRYDCLKEEQKSEEET